MMSSRSQQTTPRSQSTQPVGLNKVAAPTQQRNKQRIGCLLSLDRKTYEQFSSRSPNFQKQLFGGTLTRSVPFATSYVPKSDSQHTLAQSVATHVPESGYNSPAVEPSAKPTLNLEQLLAIETIYDQIQGLLRARAFGAAFNKCTEWWDCTAQLPFEECRDIGRTGKQALDFEKSKKLELLAVVVAQFVAHYNSMRIDEENNELTLALTALAEGHQNYLIFLREVYMCIAGSHPGNRWLKEIRDVVNSKLINDVSGNLRVVRALHNEAMLNLLGQICARRAKSAFYDTAAMCLRYVGKIAYDVIRKMMCKGLFISVNQAATMASNPRKRKESAKELYLPPLHPEQKSKSYTLVLDLDETLVHATGDSDNPNECVVRVRPGTKEFVDEMSKYYELVIFTAGTKEYADYALKFADPSGKISHRLYREHATQKGTVFVKDISRLGRDLRRVIIIDNVVENFQLQSENGIFISTWEGDEKDTALSQLAPVLKQIVDLRLPDVRAALRQYRDYQVRRIITRVRPRRDPIIY